MFSAIAALGGANGLALDHLEARQRRRHMHGRLHRHIRIGMADDDELRAIGPELPAPPHARRRSPTPLAPASAPTLNVTRSAIRAAILR